MIALFLAWTILLFVAYSFGSIAYKLCGFLWKQNQTQWNLIDIFLFGLCLISGLVNILHVLIPANTYMLLILVTSSIVYWALYRKRLVENASRAFNYIRSFPKKYLVLFVILVLLVALSCCLYPRMTDTLYYHYQNLMWNNSYPTVYGLANLQPRLGFNSNIYLLTSVFGCYSFYDQFIFSVHTLLLTMTTVWVVGKTIIGKISLRKIIALLMFVCFIVIYKIHLSSITSDFFANLLVLYLFLNIILDEKVLDHKPLLFLVLPIFIVTIKLSCAPISLLSLYIIYRAKEARIKSILCLIFAGCWIILPWCYNTYILTGYLFFPLPYFDFFNPDWKVPMHYLMEQKEFIQAFAKYPNNLDIHSISQMGIGEWFPVWWKSDMFYYNSIANRFFFFSLLITIPLGVVLCIYNRKEHNIQVVAWVISLISIIIWFFNAPDFRFVYTFILYLVFVTLYWLIGFIVKKTSSRQFSKVSSLLAYTLVLYLCFFCARWIYYQRGSDITITELIKKPTSIAYIKKARYAHYYVEDTTYGFTIYRNSFSDEGLLCFDYPLPSSADFVGGIEKRGKALEDGFRCKPNAPYRRTY